MSESDRFYHSLQKRGRYRENERSNDRETLLRNTFFIHTPVLPEDMQYDIFDRFAEEFSDPEEQVQALALLVDLFNEEYDATETVLSRDDWVYIKEITSDFGQELPEPLLTYVMSQVLEHGGFR